MRTWRMILRTSPALTPRAPPRMRARMRPTSALSRYPLPLASACAVHITFRSQHGAFTL